MTTVPQSTLYFGEEEKNVWQFRFELAVQQFERFDEV